MCVRVRGLTVTLVGARQVGAVCVYVCVCVCMICVHICGCAYACVAQNFTGLKFICHLIHPKITGCVSYSTILTLLEKQTTLEKYLVF